MLNEVVAEEGDTYAEDALLADQLDMLVFHTALCVALAVGLEVAEIAHMAIAVFRGTMLLSKWVD